MWNPEFGKGNLEKLEKMEEGEDNKVYKARQKTTGKLLLIKKYKNLCLDEDGTLPPSRLCEIIDFEALSESSNVLRLLYWYKNEKPSLYMMFEFLDMDLKKFIDSNPTPLQPNLIQSFMYQLCKGVAHWHKFVMFHRDLNPQNLLVDTEKRILKIADLGLGTPFPDIFDNVSYESFMYQLCMGVAHCHSLDVLHRDLKPENLIVDTKKGILKVADFHIKMSFIPLSEINSPQIKRPRKGLMKRTVRV
ncbi:Cyclin-dependent kinase B1-1 [Acorus calamus]|uniref:Cyclin-dependent kinase B1-1 n=1 Tax=Acorus calamus TaxID=4465 RepID=A0AAV9EI10_ACOCL|nr:Cyclin-dependent kinase B1-1 [Acorus calamus]